MKITKKLTALGLALLMVLAVPLTALAEGSDANFTLSTVQTKFFAGLTYDITATITDASESTAISHDCFEWTASATAGEASIATLDNYKYTDNGNGTYTVTETATVTMPQAGATANITAKLGSRSKTLSLVSLQPIESFDVNFVNSEHAYFYNSGTVGVLYVDRKLTDDSHEHSLFNIGNVSPSTNDDEILIAIGGYSNDKYSLEGAGNSYSLSFAKNATGSGSMNFSVLSGGKSFKNYNVEVCIPATAYNLDVKPHNSKSYINYGNNENGPYTLTNLYTGKTFYVRASGDNLGNDDIKYELYTDELLQTKAPATYLQAKNNRECELNITEQGTYWLVSKNYSKDNGMLIRDLEPVVTRIVVNQSVFADTINLYELDEDGNKTDTKLKDITLYTNTLTTYDLKKNISITPDNTTDNLVYTSTDTTVATVNDGIVTAKNKGDIIIYIKSDENANANAAVNVHVKIGVKAITKIVKQDNKTIIPSGHIQKLQVTTNPAVVDEPIYWSSSNREILAVDRFTGVITAKEVTEDTIVTINAVSETGVRGEIPITVVPANRATNVTLSANANSTTYTEKQGDPYIIYSDYYQSNPPSRTQFNITAEIPGESGEVSNDEFVWSLSYNGAAGLSFDEASEQGLITFKDSNDHRTYLITPQKQGTYAITCTATTNVTETQPDDPSDTIIIEIVQTATNLSIKDTDTGNTTAGTVYIPIGGIKEITVKSSTADNNKLIDPPVYKIIQGANYVNVTERKSDDGEGITYRIEGLSYGFEATKITFSSRSGSRSSTIVFYVRNNLTNAEVRGIDEDGYEYTGSAIKPEISVYYGGYEVDPNCYTVSYSVNNKATNINVGTATITITGKADYQGSKKVVTFSIVPKAFDDNVKISEITDRKLTEKERETKPAPNVTVNGKTLKKDVDYTLTYSNNKAAGTRTVIVNGIGNYKGTAKSTFKILDTAVKFSVAALPLKTFTGKPIKPLPVIKYNGAILKKDIDYTLAYSYNTYPGVATITITGIGRFYGTTKATFNIKPAKAKIVSLTKGSKQISVTVKVQREINGYQIKAATDKKFKKGKKTVLLSPYYSTATVTGLKGKKLYYVKVRAYKEINGVRVYGKWSKVKTIKTNK